MNGVAAVVAKMNVGQHSGPAADGGAGWRRRVEELRRDLEAMAHEMHQLRQLALLSTDKTPESLRVTGDAAAVELDGARRELRICDGQGGRAVRLTVKELELMSLLLSHPGRVWSRASLQHQLWGIDNKEQQRNVDAHINRLRHKLGSLSDHLEGVYGAGYRWRVTGSGRPTGAGTPVMAAGAAAEPPLPLGAERGEAPGEENRSWQ